MSNTAKTGKKTGLENNPFESSISVGASGCNSNMKKRKRVKEDMEIQDSQASGSSQVTQPVNKKLKTYTEKVNNIYQSTSDPIERYAKLLELMEK